MTCALPFSGPFGIKTRAETGLTGTPRLFRPPGHHAPVPGIFAYADPAAAYAQGLGLVWHKHISRGAKKGWGHVKKAGEFVGDAIVGGVEMAVGEVVELVRAGYDWVVKKVSGIDDWIRENVPGYTWVSDTIIEVGNSLIITIGEALDKTIDVILIDGGRYIGGLAAGLACSLGVVAGIPVDPWTCRAVGMMVGEYLGRKIHRIKESVKRRWRGANQPQDLPPEVAGLLRGLESRACEIPLIPDPPQRRGRPKPICLLPNSVFWEPPPAWTARQKADFWREQQTKEGYGCGTGLREAYRSYYACRERTERFADTMGQLAARSNPTHLLNRALGPTLMQRNTIQSLERLNRMGDVTVVPVGSQDADGGDWMLWAAGAVALGAGVAVMARRRRR